MDEAQVLAAVITAVRQETEDETTEITAQTAASDVPGWDSLAHVRIVMNIEAQLGMSIEINDTYAAGNVGELVDLIVRLARRG